MRQHFQLVDRFASHDKQAKASVIDATLLNAGRVRRKLGYISMCQWVSLCVKVSVNNDIPRLVFGYEIKDCLVQVLCGTNTHQLIETVEFPKKSNNYVWRDLAMIFHVVNISKSHFSGLTWLEPQIGVTL